MSSDTLHNQYPFIGTVKSYAESDSSSTKLGEIKDKYSNDSYALLEMKEDNYSTDLEYIFYVLEMFNSDGDLNNVALGIKPVNNPNAPFPIAPEGIKHVKGHVVDPILNSSFQDFKLITITHINSYKCKFLVHQSELISLNTRETDDIFYDFLGFRNNYPEIFNLSNSKH